MIVLFYLLKTGLLILLSRKIVQVPCMKKDKIIHKQFENSSHGFIDCKMFIVESGSYEDGNMTLAFDVRHLEKNCQLKHKNQEISRKMSLGL